MICIVMIKLTGAFLKGLMDTANNIRFLASLGMTGRVSNSGNEMRLACGETHLVPSP